ncbi:MAG: glycosyltransferase family 4 protein, partial [Pseudomonadales bacterium]|nr:glycosyltransferase family 4 protein [Pseudomonadales bacterium]
RALITIQQSIPVIATIHHPITSDRDIELSNSKTPMERIFIKRWHNFLKMQIRVAKQLPVILTVSENSKRDLCRDYGLNKERVHVVYNGIDTADFYPQNQQTNNIHRNPWQLITTASADHPLKGTRHLLRAFGLLQKEFPELRLTIIGKLKEGGKNELLCRELNIQHKISQRHDISIAEIRDLYAESSIAVVPSDYEGFGLPTGEAMACGIPVVSSDGGALPEVIGDAGLLVPAKNPQALAGAIRKLLIDADLRLNLAQQGLDRVRNLFGWDRAAQETVALYRAHLNNSSSTLKSTLRNLYES